jgi:hypothetical protein
MSLTSGTPEPSVEAVIREIRRRKRKRHSDEEKICIVHDGLMGKKSTADAVSACRLSQEFIEAWKERPADDPASEGNCTGPQMMA